MELRGKSVLVTGSEGFFGKWLVKELKSQGTRVIIAPHTKDPSEGVDLLQLEQAKNALENIRPQYVFHLAGFNGGISLNLKRPADIFTRNTMMALNVLEACRVVGVKKVVSVVASCAYPMEEWFNCYDDEHPWRPKEVLAEDSFLNGEPHDTVAGHAYAKRNLQLASHFYNQQYGCNFVCACPTTLYGPGDSFDPAKTKVMGGLIKKIVDAADNNEQEVILWGTGKPLREFLHVRDAASLLIDVLGKYDDSSMPLNLGTGQEVTIKALADLIADVAGFRGEIYFDDSKPDGAYRKRLDCTRMNKILGEREFISLRDGIEDTVSFYRSTR